MKAISNYFDGILDRIFSVLGAVSLAQFPQYIQQYLQRLGGHADEARRIVLRFNEAAVKSGRTLEDYILRFLLDSDPDISRQGEIMQEAVDRAAYLSDAVAALESANLFTRPFVFLSNLDTEIAMSALRVFQPGLPTTIEGGVYAFVGILLGLLVYNGLKWPVRSFQRRKSPNY